MFGLFYHAKVKHSHTKPVSGGLETAKEFSRASYQKENNRPRHIQGFNYDDELSNKRNAVYHNPDTGRLIVAFRGTDPTDTFDLWEDARIATGTFDGADRIKKGKDIVKSASTKYSIPVREVELTGHSLGGRIAQSIGTKLKSERITAINPGSSPIDVIHPTAGAGAGRTFTTGVDPISLSNTVVNPSSVRFRAPQAVNIHGLGAFG